MADKRLFLVKAVHRMMHKEKDFLVEFLIQKETKKAMKMIKYLSYLFPDGASFASLHEGRVVTPTNWGSLVIQ